MIEFSLLHSLNGKLAKTVSFDLDDAEWKVADYTAGMYFDAMSGSARDIREFSDLLFALEEAPDACLVRGQLKSGVDASRVQRLMHDQGPVQAVFQSVPRQWVMLDIDGVPATSWGASNADRLATVISDLPEPFHDVSYHYQWSSKAGIRGWDTLSLHLFFALDEPWLDQMLRERCQDENWGVDRSVFNAVQIHYTAAPVFTGEWGDPLKGKRSGFVEGKSDVVSLGTWTRPAKLSRPNYLPKQSALELFESKLGTIGKNFHGPIISAVMTLVAASRNQFDEDQCREMILAAVAKSNSGRGYINDRYLDNVLRTARTKYENGVN